MHGVKRRSVKEDGWFSRKGIALAAAAAALAAWLGAAKAAEKAPPGTRIQHIDLVHFSHTDYGFTDHPAVCRELQRRYLDIAVDGVLATCGKPPEARLLLDGRNDRRRQRLVAGGLARAARRVPAGRGRRANWRSRRCR